MATIRQSKQDYELELIEEEDSSKQGLHQGERLPNGQFAPGISGNPGGRPKSGEDIASRFRDNPKGLDVINNVIEVASTFGSDKQHKDAVAAVKLVIERLVPALRSSDLNVNMSDDKGFIYMPTQTNAKTEDK